MIKVITPDVYKNALEDGKVEELFCNSLFLNVAISCMGNNKKIEQVEFRNCVFKGYFFNYEFHNVLFKNCILFDHESFFINCKFVDCVKKSCDF